MDFSMKGTEWERKEYCYVGSSIKGRDFFHPFQEALLWGPPSSILSEADRSTYLTSRVERERF